MSKRLARALAGALVVATLATGAATAAGYAPWADTAPWSEKRLTYHVKKLRAENATLRLQLRDLDANDQAIAQHHDGLITDLIDCLEKPERDEAACVAERFAGVVR